METLYNQCFGKTSGGVEILQDLVLFSSYQGIRIYCALNRDVMRQRRVWMMNRGNNDGRLINEGAD